MSSLITNATIQIKQDTAGNWTSNNPTPASGEWCLETDTKYIKIGDGSTEWTSLDYQPNPAEVDGKASLSTYSTGWVSNSDWTNAELTVTHNLTANLSDLITELFISSDGTEANAIKIITASTGTASRGFNIYHVSTSEIKVQTGSSGIVYLNDSGSVTVLGASSAFYYKVKVYKLS